MRLTQMLAVLNGEVKPSRYHLLSHYDPRLDSSWLYASEKTVEPPESEEKIKKAKILLVDS